MDVPLVSVLMTAFNREKYIAEAIESVLASTYKNFELIIVDDCSKDSTVAIARHYESKDARVKVYVNERNLGDYPNRNRAASLASGKYIKYLDADDILYNYALVVMLSYMEECPDAGFGLASIVSNVKLFLILLTPREIYLENFNGYSHFDRAPGSSIIKLDAFREVGGFSGKRMIGDYEFWLKISCYFSMVKFPFDLYWNRIHPDQESKTEYSFLYPELRKRVLNDALSFSNCPLLPNEITRIKHNIKVNEIKSWFFSKLNYLRKRVGGIA